MQVAQLTPLWSSSPPHHFLQPNQPYIKCQVLLGRLMSHGQQILIKLVNIFR
jgi:hypothetical protein